MGCEDVLQNKHTVVALEIVKDHDNVSNVSLLCDGKFVQVDEHVVGAVLTIKHLGLVALGIQAEHDEGLHFLFVGDGHVINEHVERRRFELGDGDVCLRRDQVVGVAIISEEVTIAGRQNSTAAGKRPEPT